MLSKANASYFERHSFAGDEFLKRFYDLTM